MQIKFENWKSGKQAVVRNNKGQFVTKTRVKGSGIKTKKAFIKQYKDTGSLSKKTAIVSNKINRVGNFKKSKKPKKNKKILKIKGKDGTKTLTTDYKRVELIGKNTALIHSEKSIKGEKRYQFITTVYWGKDKIKTVGYSNLKNKKGTPTQAFNRAYGHAISLGLLRYDYTIKLDSDANGEAISPNGKHKVAFTYNTEVGTYVQTATNTKTTKRT